MQQIEIRVKGLIDRGWEDWLGGLKVSPGENETVIAGTIHDHAALRGILNRMADLGLQLISVNTGNPVPPKKTRKPKGRNNV
jgi:hypothetical protein